MNKFLRAVSFFITFLIFTNSLLAQYESRGNQFDYEDAEQFFLTKNYYDALPLYDSLIIKYPKVMEYQLKRGICHIHLNKSPEKSIAYIKDVYDKKPKTGDVLYYLGKAYALNYKFDLAIETFSLALENSRTSTGKKKEIPHLIDQCNNAKELIKDSLNVRIENLGEPINSIDNEYGPTINADESTLIFTYRGPKSLGERQDEFNRMSVNGNFYDDVYIATKNEGKWSVPEPISDSINSNLHEGSIALSPDGQTLFTYKDTKENSGDIFINIKGEYGWSEPKWLSINSEYWEGSAAISPDGNLLFFSSDRKGGYGGKDIYSAKKNEDGSWGQVMNLGPTINTAYDDDSPFIHSDGVTFNFSSKGHKSIGGYDIFEAKIGNDSTYTAPKNIGYPINTTSDDIFFFVSGRGNAYYSSVRKGGYGQSDIYVINVKDIISSKPVFLVKGIIHLDEKPVRSKIVLRTKRGEDLGTYYSDHTSGKYQFYVDLNEAYTITYEYGELESQIESIDATVIKEYTEIDKNIQFIAKDVTIDGIALEGSTLSPIANLKVELSNKNKTINNTQLTDDQGKYQFPNLPNDEYSLSFSSAEGLKYKKDSIYTLKGRIIIKDEPYVGASMNETLVDDQGNYQVQARARYFFGLLKWDYSLLDMMTEKDIMEKFGDEVIDGLIYKVQVGAYADPANFDRKHLEKLGNIEETILDDGLTRFTIGDYSTLNEVNKMKKKAIKKGQLDAFIIMFVNGKRTYLNELIK